jgi:hypothetical protein
LKRLDGQHGPVVGHSKIFVSTKNKNFKFQLINYCVIFKSKKIIFISNSFFNKVNKIQSYFWGHVEWSVDLL